jgi:hypothetical protein
MSLHHLLAMKLRPAAVILIAALLIAAPPASATLALTGPPQAVEKNYHFTVPFSLTLAHPCQPALVFITGSTTVNLTAVTGSSFKMSIKMTATGTGQEAGANGLPLANGSLPYDYTSEVLSTTEFPDGTPAYFGHTLTVAGEMARPAADDPDILEVFTVKLIFDVEYKNGVPGAPTLKTIDVSCQ